MHWYKQTTPAISLTIFCIVRKKSSTIYVILHCLDLHVCCNTCIWKYCMEWLETGHVTSASTDQIEDIRFCSCQHFSKSILFLFYIVKYVIIVVSHKVLEWNEWIDLIELVELMEIDWNVTHIKNFAVNLTNLCAFLVQRERK